LADPTRFERATFAFGGRRSIQLSYGSIGILPDPGTPYRDIHRKPQSRRSDATGFLPPWPFPHSVSLLLGCHGRRIGQRNRMVRQGRRIGPAIRHCQAVGAEPRFFRRWINRPTIALAIIQPHDRAIPPGNQRIQRIQRTAPYDHNAAHGYRRRNAHRRDRRYRRRQAAAGQQRRRRRKQIKSQEQTYPRPSHPMILHQKGK
jgi:hypothetical protein